MDVERIARRTLMFGMIAAFVLSLGPMEALGFNPQPDPPKQGALSPSANPAPVIQSPATVPKTPAGQGTVFPKVNMLHSEGMKKVVVPKVGEEKGGATAPAIRKSGDITLKRGYIGPSPQGDGVPVPPPPDYKRPAEFMPGSLAKPGEEKMGVDPTPWKPGGGEQGIIVQRPAEFSPAPQGAAKGNVETEFKVEKGEK